MNVILTTAYFPPIEYFKAIIRYDNIYLEINENYSRQSYRNRCNILSSNGMLPLSIPIIKPNNIKQNILEVKIDYSTNWQKLHINAITSAYGKSPYFPFYSDVIIKSISQNNKYLFDFNLKVIDEILIILNVKKEINKTTSFLKSYDNNFLDLRYCIHPKQNTFNFINVPYIQTFNDRFEFIPNLSIIDLIFNVGTVPVPGWRTPFFILIQFWTDPG